MPDSKIMVDPIDTDGDLKTQWLKASAEFAKDCHGENLNQKASPEQVLAIISAQKDEDNKESVKRKRYQKAIENTMVCLQIIGGVVDQAASMFFGPSDMCMNAVSFFVQAAVAYKKIFSDLDNLWEMISNALDRFRIYMDHQSVIDVGMKKIANQILIQFVEVCKLSRKVLTTDMFKQLRQMAKTAFFKNDAGTGDAIQALTSLVTKETQTRDTYGYVAIKDTQKHVVEGFEQTNQGLSQANEGIAELKSIASKDDRKRKLSEISEKLRKPPTDEQRNQLIMYTQNAVPETGKWVFNWDKYQFWAEKDVVEHPIMFLSGDEKCGKTYLISAIIQDLLNRHSHGNEDMRRISVAYYYFKKSESAKGEGQEQYCTTNMALRALAYQVAENDPIYRKNLASIENNKVISTYDILELWNLLLVKPIENVKLIENVEPIEHGNSIEDVRQIENAAKIFLIIDGTHELEHHQLAELGKVLVAAASRSSKMCSVRAMIAGRTEHAKTLSKELGNAALTIDIVAHNRDDISTFVRKELDTMPLLEHFETLRDEIYKSLMEIANGNFGHIGLLLQQISTKRRQDEIKELLEKAKMGSFHDSIADVIEEGNQKLSDMDIDDLNQLLEWTMSREYPYTLRNLEAILHSRRESLSLVPLYDRLKNEFSGFFTVDPDSNEPEASVSLMSNKIKEHFQNRSESEVKTQQSQHRITKVEVDIIQRFLKNLCDDELYQKFEFEQFFKQKSGAASRIHVDTEEMHGKVALDCLKIKLGETNDAAKSLGPWCDWILVESLESADLSYLGPKVKGEVGRRLVPLFTENKAWSLWQMFDSGSQWFTVHDKEDVILKWFRDTAAMKSISDDERAWVDSIKSNSDNGQHDLLENIAKAAAKALLVGDKGDELDTEDIELSYIFVRGYLNKIEHKKNQDIPRLTDSTYYEFFTDGDTKSLLDWARQQSGITDLTYSYYYRVAKIYHLRRNYKKAEEIFQRAISLQDDNAYEARCGLADLYADANVKDFSIAVDTMSEVSERLSMLPTPSEKEQERLKTSLKKIAAWKKRLLLYDDAMEIYQKLLSKDAGDYAILCEILSLLADRNDLGQVLGYINDLQSQTDGETENDRLTQLLLSRADDEGVHDIISHTARELQYSSKIQESYEKAIQIAEMEAGKDKAKPSVKTVLYLKHSLASSLHRRGTQAEILKAIKLWEEITAQRELSSDFWITWWLRRRAYCRLCLHYLAEARSPGMDSSSADQFVAKVKSVVEGLPKEREALLEEYEMKALLGHHFAVVGQKEQAKQQLKSIIEIGIGLLSDDDDTNDHQGYMRLADGFMRFRDDENALAALSLVGPTRNLPPEYANDEPLQHDSVAKITQRRPSESELEPTHDKGEPIPDRSINITDPNSESELHTQPSLKRSGTSAFTEKPIEKPSGPISYGCDCDRETCDESYTFADNWYFCRQCLDGMLFTPTCYELLRQGKLRRHVCDKSHDFFYVPPWDYEKARRVGKGNVQVGERIVTIKEWLDGIRRDWDIKG